MGQECPPSFWALGRSPFGILSRQHFAAAPISLLHDGFEVAIGGPGLGGNFEAEIADARGHEVVPESSSDTGSSALRF